MNCATEWCTARWRGRIGYMIATNLDLAGPGPGPVAGGPPVVVYDDPGPMVYGPPYYYGPRYYGPRYYWGPRHRHWRRW